jgi:tetratricopeptide (TPR) repeat protein
MQAELNRALDLHQRGLLDDASRQYQTILAGNPDHPDALHLFGVLAHQLGNHARAAELIERAIAAAPGVSAYHGNLAEVYRSLGQLERAASSCRSALQLQPDNPQAHNGLGLVLLAWGRPEAALPAFREAIRLRPDFALAWSNLGNALRLLGEKEQALAHFRRAAEIDPGAAEAHSNLGQFLLERKQLDEALVHCREAVRLRPGFAPAHSNLGNVLREMNRLAEAKAAYAEALRLSPGVGMIHNNIAQTLQEEGRLEDAVGWYRRALELDAGAARIHSNLASALMEQDKQDEPIACYEQARRLDPGYAPAVNGLGWVRHEQGRYDEAQALYREALRLDPELTAARCNLGTVLEELSDFTQAERCFREALQLDPRLPGALAQLATLLRKKLPDADLTAMRQLLADPYLSEGQRSCLHFGLAQALDARGDYEQAGEHLGHANRLAAAELCKRDHAYDPGAHARFVDQLIAAFSPEFFEGMRGLGVPSDRPIFIVGLPRSGTTLTEQILASHSQVFGAGELRLARDDFESVGAGDASEGACAQALGRLDAELVRTVALRHLERLHELDAEKAHVVDKMPDNHLYLGLLAVLFPRAKFIHCRRDVRDVAVSCWMTNFRHIRWANDPEHIAARFHDYERLTEHWRRVLPVDVLEVDYEETVADLEGVARRLVAWCGLEWESGCLSFHEGKRPVRTASVAQVRQPVYVRSVGRWRHYEKALGGLFARLVPGTGAGQTINAPPPLAAP